MFVHLTTICTNKEFLSFSNILHFIRYIKIIMNFNIITTTFSSFTNIWWLISGFTIMSEVLCSWRGYSLRIAIFVRFTFYVCLFLLLFFIQRSFFFQRIYIIFLDFILILSSI